MKDYCQTLRKGCSFMLKRAPLLSHSMLLLLFCMVVQTCVAQEDPDINGITGYKGMQALKRNWRPFNNNSFWNKTIPVTADTHPDSEAIINELTVRNYPKEIYLRLGEEWNPTLHVVGSQASKFHYQARSDILVNGVIVGVRHGKIYRFTHFNLQNCWNPDALDDGQDVTDGAWPFIPGVTYPAKVDDGLMIVVDKSAGNKFTAYEVSHGHDYVNTDGYAQCTTFNIWNLGYTGVVTYRPLCSSATSGPSGGGGAACASCDDYWQHAGGHGAGTSLIAGLIRPGELNNALAAPLSPEDPNYNPDVATGDGLIHHALKFSYDQNRNGPPLYPFAYRNDGLMTPTPDETRKYPVEGMLFQLRPDFDESTIDNEYGKVIVRTLKTYGMVLVDNGSNGKSMALYLQNMYTPGSDTATNRAWWDLNYQNIHESITGPSPDHNIPRIKASDFRVVDTESLYLSHYLTDHISP